MTATSPGNLKRKQKVNTTKNPPYSKRTPITVTKIFWNHCCSSCLPYLLLCEIFCISLAKPAEVGWALALAGHHLRLIKMIGDYFRRQNLIQYRTGVWKCSRNLCPDPSASTGKKFWAHGCKIFIRYWAAVWHPHRESTTELLPAPALDKNRSPTFANVGYI